MILLKLLAFVLPLGLDSFAVAAALAAAGKPTGRTRIRISALFVVFEAGMPLIGLALGAPLAHAVGDLADYLAAAAVLAVGAWMLIHGDNDDEQEQAGRLITARGAALIGLGVSIGGFAAPQPRPPASRGAATPSDSAAAPFILRLPLGRLSSSVVITSNSFRGVVDRLRIRGQRPEPARLAGPGCSPPAAAPSLAQPAHHRAEDCRRSVPMVHTRSSIPRTLSDMLVDTSFETSCVLVRRLWDVLVDVSVQIRQIG